MSYGTLTTHLTEVERILNDRPLLRTRTKWTQRRRDLQVGDLLLIIGDTYARKNLPKGLVVSFDPGGDGLVRQAKIRTWKGQARTNALEEEEEEEEEQALHALNLQDDS
ncbi:unnamed protein product [Schistosoma mattheei]|uniref:Uncharacterized protein n=1 Tax=Schistosoma mattheei TaxID=31246 RepID=A0A183NQE5_9TREM|nr:unnamed protein product [Schistosoma mattheei]